MKNSDFLVVSNGVNLVVFRGASLTNQVAGAQGFDEEMSEIYTFLTLFLMIFLRISDILVNFHDFLRISDILDTFLTFERLRASLRNSKKRLF